MATGSFSQILPVRILRRCWQLVVILVVLLAVYTTAGRMLMPLVGGQVVGIEAQLSQLLGATIKIGELHGGWFRFSPTLEIRELTLTAGTGTNLQQHGIRQLTLELDVIESLRHGSPVKIKTGGAPRAAPPAPAAPSAS